MKKALNSIKTTVKPNKFRKILKIIGFSLLGLITILLIAAVGLSIYFNKHKEVIVADINKQINENIKGTITIGDIDYTLIKGFPNFALTISNVVLKDSLWAQHKHTLLDAKEIEVHLNIKKLVLDKEVDIEKIKINDAKINMYVDQNGYSNSNIFKPKPIDTVAKPKKKTIIEALALENVEFISQNIQRDKLFDFDVTSLESDIEYTETGWQTDLFINTLAKSMAFKLSKGSFIKNKRVKGDLNLTFSTEKNQITIVTEKLEIGVDEFDIIAHFDLDKKNPLFDLDITTEILWKNATELLDAHIAQKLNPFNITEPINVNCTINGNTSVAGDPVIVVKALIKNNVVTIPDGKFTSCSFKGEYNNTLKKGQGTSDENSAVIITNFSGDYLGIPIEMPKAMIYNLSKPLVSGTFKSKFEATQLNQFMNEDVMVFSDDGTVDVNLKFNLNIVALKIDKPIFSGNVAINNATLNYKPKEIAFKNTDVVLNFTENELTIDKLKYTNDKNTVFLKGQIDNFFALYYKGTGKMTLNWDVYCPSFDAQQFITMLGKNKKPAAAKKVKKNLVSSKLESMIDESQVLINVKADKMTYKNLVATSVFFNIELIDDQLAVKNGLIKTCNGQFSFDAQLTPKNNQYNLVADAKINTVAIPQFLTAFNNFGITSFQPNDIKGKLTVITSFKCAVSPTGELIENTIVGKVNYNVVNGALDNFEPIMKVGKIAFPNRDMKNIDFNELEGKLDVNGELITVDNFNVSSNVINFDVAGIYSFGKGTNLQMTIPLRNPENDYKITDSIQRADLRYKGVVLHLKAIDGPDGKIQIKLDPQGEQTFSPFKSNSSTKTSEKVQINNPFKKSSTTKNEKNTTN